jgi:hypothetical protein
LAAELIMQNCVCRSSTLAALARGGMKAEHDDLVEALDGMFDDHHGGPARLLMDQISSSTARAPAGRPDRRADCGARQGR